MEKTVYLFRHGTPEESLRGRCRGGETHCDLSPEGIAQTHANIAYLLSSHSEAEIRSMHVWTSGMERSDYFGRVMQEQGARHHVDERFKTIGAGQWEGKNWDEIKEVWPEQHKLAVESAEHLVMPEGEPVSVFRARVRRAFYDCVHTDASHVVIVGHGCTNDVILAEAEQRRTLRFRDQPIACMNKISIDADGTFRVLEKQQKAYESFLALSQ